MEPNEIKNHSATINTKCYYDTKTCATLYVPLGLHDTDVGVTIWKGLKNKKTNTTVTQDCLLKRD